MVAVDGAVVGADWFVELDQHAFCAGFFVVGARVPDRTFSLLRVIGIAHVSIQFP